jgi:hypothetical protein
MIDLEPGDLIVVKKSEWCSGFTELLVKRYKKNRVIMWSCVEVVGNVTKIIEIEERELKDWLQRNFISLDDTTLIKATT